MEVITTNTKFILTDEEIKALRTTRTIFSNFSDYLHDDETLLDHGTCVLTEVKDVLTDFVKILKNNHTITCKK